jgi:GT2 family glycosyltransferase
MTLSTAVVIATKGRPQEVSKLLGALALQTVNPKLIVVSASHESDIEPNLVLAKNVELLFGPPGLTAQRNRGLSLARNGYDLVVFFDDDFIPSRFWIERAQYLFARQIDLGTVTGRVLLDAIKVGELPWSEGQAIVDRADCSNEMPGLSNYRTWTNSPYGCNMAYRTKAIEGMMFDERLALSGWLEDLDFGLRAGRRGGMVSTDFVWGVHLGSGGGRGSDVRFGYSQIVNPWYLMKKGVINPLDGVRRIGQGLASNAIRVVQKSHVDRRGRIIGNLMGIKDIVTGKWAPERIAEF